MKISNISKLALLAALAASNSVFASKRTHDQIEGERPDPAAKRLSQEAQPSVLPEVLTSAAQDPLAEIRELQRQRHEAHTATQEYQDQQEAEQAAQAEKELQGKAQAAQAELLHENFIKDQFSPLVIAFKMNIKKSLEAASINEIIGVFTNLLEGLQYHAELLRNSKQDKVIQEEIEEIRKWVYVLVHEMSSNEKLRFNNMVSSTAKTQKAELQELLQQIATVLGIEEIDFEVVPDIAHDEMIAQVAGQQAQQQQIAQDAVLAQALAAQAQDFDEQDVYQAMGLPAALPSALPPALPIEQADPVAAVHAVEADDVGTVKLISNDGFDYSIEKKVASQSGTIKAMLSGDYASLEVKFDGISGSTLENILQSLEIISIGNSNETMIKTELSKFIILQDMSMQRLKDFLLAANFLDIPQVLKAAVIACSNILKDVSISFDTIKRLFAALPFEIKTLVANQTNDHGVTSLGIAAANGNTPLVQLLLENGADANLVSDNSSNLKFFEQGLAPILHAAKNGYVKIVELLIKHGANVNVCDKVSNTALFFAVDNNSFAIVYALLKAPCFSPEIYAQLNTALITAARKDNKDIISFLIANGARASQRQGLGALLWAATNGNAGIIAQLLAAGADVNRSDICGDTCLIRAAEYGKMDVVRVLLKAPGFIANMHNQLNVACMRAAQNGHPAIEQLLREHGAV